MYSHTYGSGVSEAEAYPGQLQQYLDAREPGVFTVIIEYPVHRNAFAAANMAMRFVAKRYDVPIVLSEEAVAGLPMERRKMLWALHPNAGMYHEIALDLGPLVLAARAARK